MRVLIRPDWAGDFTMKRIRHTAEQIIRKLKTAEQLIAQGRLLPMSVASSRSPSRPITAVSSSRAGCRPRKPSGSPNWRRRTQASRSFWPKLNWRRRCLRSWRRETSEPATTAQGRGGPARHVPGIRAVRLQGGGPTPQPAATCRQSCRH